MKRNDLRRAWVAWSDSEDAGKEFDIWEDQLKNEYYLLEGICSDDYLSGLNAAHTILFAKRRRGEPREKPIRYDDAISEYSAEKSRKEAVETVIDDALLKLLSCVEEPLGRGYGYGFTRDAQDILRLAIKEARSIYND